MQMYKKTIIFFLFVLSLNVSSQSIAFTPGDRAVIVHDKYSSAYYYVFEQQVPENDDGVIILPSHFNSPLDSLNFIAKNLLVDHKYEECINVLHRVIDTEIDTLEYNSQSVSKALHMLKNIYFDEKKYDLALYINNKEFEGLTPIIADFSGDIRRGEAIVRENRTFIAKCYYNLGEYDSALNYSAGYIKNDEMCNIFVNSAVLIYGAKKVKDEFIKEFDAITVPDWRFGFYNDTTMILGENSININILGHNLSYYFPLEIYRFQSDLAYSRITKAEADKKLKAMFKYETLYKLIINN